MQWSKCPANSDQAAEAYLQGRLSREEVIAFEEHYLSCPRCSERLQFTDTFIVAFHRAAERHSTMSVAAGASQGL